MRTDRNASWTWCYCWSFNNLSLGSEICTSDGKVYKMVLASKVWQKSSTINTDKAPSYGAVIEILKNEGKCPKDLEYRQVKYLNNRIEADHGKLKRLIIPVRGFKSMKTAYTQSERQALPQSKVLKWYTCSRKVNLNFGCMEIRLMQKSA